MAQDEPVVIAGGVFLIAGAAWATQTTGIGSEIGWGLAGGVLITAGVLARYTDWLDFEDVV